MSGKTRQNKVMMMRSSRVPSTKISPKGIKDLERTQKGKENYQELYNVHRSYFIQRVVTKEYPDRLLAPVLKQTEFPEVIRSPSRVQVWEELVARTIARLGSSDSARSLIGKIFNDPVFIHTCIAYLRYWDVWNWLAAQMTNLVSFRDPSGNTALDCAIGHGNPVAFGAIFRTLDVFERSCDVSMKVVLPVFNGLNIVNIAYGLVDTMDEADFYDMLSVIVYPLYQSRASVFDPSADDVDDILDSFAAILHPMFSFEAPLVQDDVHPLSLEIREKGRNVFLSCASEDFECISSL